jgi:hypothetical protein
MAGSGALDSDWRGVDLCQIREKLALTPEQRLAELVAFVELMSQMRAAAGTSRAHV